MGPVAPAQARTDATFQIRTLFALTAAGCVLLVGFPIPGCLLFGPSFGALFRHYLDCVWAPVRCAQFEFLGQCVAAIAFVPMVWYGLGWNAVLVGTATVASVASLIVKADRRLSADSPAPPRILWDPISPGGQGTVDALAGTRTGPSARESGASVSVGPPGSFHRPAAHPRPAGGILVISDSEGRWGGDVTAVVATAAILAGALFAAIVSGFKWPTASQRYQAGAYVCSATAVTSMWATDTEHFLIMSIFFGFGAGLVLINARSLCFNASNVYFILSQRLADTVGPILLAVGLSPRALMQAAPAFISTSLLLLPSGVDQLSDIRVAGLR
jgi:hypothetical protein